MAGSRRNLPTPRGLNRTPLMAATHRTVQMVVSWDAALALRTSLTVGWDIALGARTSPTVSWDASLLSVTQKTVSWDAALGLRTLLTVSWDSALATRTVPTVSWDAALGTRRTLSVSWDAALAPRTSLTVSWDIALATRTVPTVGWDAALAARTLPTVGWDTALAARLSLTTNWDIALGKRVVPTVNWDSILVLRPSLSVLWDAAIGLSDSVAVPTDAEIADSLSGLRAPVVIRYRYEQRDHDFTFQADVTAAVESCSISLDNNRAVLRTAQFVIRPHLLPDDFDEDNDHIAVFAEVLSARSQYVSYSLGLFHLASIDDRPQPNNNEIWGVQGADVGIHLFEHSFSYPYSIPAGTLYTDAINAILALVGLRNTIEPSTLRTPVAFTWAPDAQYGTIVNDLLEGMNFYPCWADREGKITSRQRINPYLEDVAVTYSSTDEPRMIRPVFSRTRERGRYMNRVIVTLKDPARTPASVQVTNDDDDCPVSTVRKEAITSNTVATDRIANAALMTDVASFLLRDAAIKAQVGMLATHPDPRRDAHEFYTVTIETTEVASPWRVEAWDYPCVTGATMQHRIGRNDQVDLTELVLV